jgi:hypothetical protein
MFVNPFPRPSPGAATTADLRRTGPAVPPAMPADTLPISPGTEQR